MPKGNATAQAYQVEMKDGKLSFTYKGLVSSSLVVRVNELAVNNVLNGFTIHIHANDRNQFNELWSKANGSS